MKSIKNSFCISQAFSIVFGKAIEKAEPAEDVKTRVINLIDSITYSVFTYTSRGLFEKDKLIFVTQMCFTVSYISTLEYLSLQYLKYLKTRCLKLEYLIDEYPKLKYLKLKYLKPKYLKPKYLKLKYLKLW